MNRLFTISLGISLIGILILFILAGQITPKEITTNSTIKPNEQVKIIGKIISEKKFEDFKILTLEDSYGKIQIICNCKRALLNKTVEVKGKMEEYNNKSQINAEEIILT